MSKSRIQISAPVKIIAAPQNNKATAGVILPHAQPDLMFMQSVLVTTGENKNEDVFLPQEMWDARLTPAYKPVDWEHNTGRELTQEEQAQNPGKVVIDNQTIGVMYNAYVVDDDHQRIDESKTFASDFEIPSHFHIIDEAVIWKSLYPQTAARIERDATEGKLFVSMEAWFTDYDYLVGDKVVARNEETAFLDDSLRANGGAGTFGKSRVRRVLRNITFGGKGIVARPANEPSVIKSITHEPMCASANHNEAIANNVLYDIRNTKASEPRRDSRMSKVAENNAQVASASVPLEQFTKAHDELAELRVESKSKDAEITKANETIAELEGQVENIKSAFTKGAEQLDGLLQGFASKVSKGNPENFFSILADVLEEDQKQKEEISSKLQAALEKVAKIEEESRTAAREARIDMVLANTALSDDERKAKKDKLSASVKSLGDEEFNALLDTLAEITPKAAPAEGTMHGDKEGKDKKGKDKKEKTKEMASLLNVSEDAAASILQALSANQDQSDDEDGLVDAVLASVKPAELTPSAGEDNSDEGLDLTKSFASLVDSMMNAHKPKSEE